ncbi:MAG: ZIP family metal transporter [bacterium]
MIEWFSNLTPVYQSLLGGCFTWAVTALGAGLVFTTRSVSQGLLNAMLGFAAGVMIAASFFSLLLPSIEYAEFLGFPAWLPAVGGFLLGGVFLRLADALLPHLHPFTPIDAAEGISTTWRRSTLLVLAITLHNIPEGLAIGVAFAAAAAQLGLPGGATLAGAVALTIGIGLQNFPEGVAVALPLRREGVGVGRCFWYGQLSAVVEPIAAVVGALAVTQMQTMLPWALAFAAGAMIFVVVEELIPASQSEGSTDIATLGTMGGFAVMMLLDVALG